MQPEVAVIGAGIVGLTAARALTEAGASVRVYERGVPGAGQSGGEGRIFRHAHDDVRLVELARESRAIWREWEEDLGAELVSADGAIALGDSALERLEILERAGGLRARRIGSGELAEALPILASYDGPAVLDPDGGTIRTASAIAVLAARLGDALVADEVLSVRPREGGGAEVRAGGGTASFDSVVVCAGRGTPELARTAGIALPVETAAHVRVSFAVAGEPPERLATLQDGSGAFPESGTYAATEPGNRGYGVGLSETTRVDDGGLVDTRGLPALADRAVAYVREALPGLRPEPTGVRHCWVTELPWSEDGVAVWSAGPVHFLAGHNLFKLAPVLGRRLAALATGGELDPGLKPEARLGDPSSAG